MHEPGLVLTVVYSRSISGPFIIVLLSCSDRLALPAQYHHLKPDIFVVCSLSCLCLAYYNNTDHAVKMQKPQNPYTSKNHALASPLYCSLVSLPHHHVQANTHVRFLLSLWHSSLRKKWPRKVAPEINYRSLYKIPQFGLAFYARRRRALAPTQHQHRRPPPPLFGCVCQPTLYL